MAGPLLEVKGLKRSFGGFQALGGVSFQVEAGEDLGGDRAQRRGQDDLVQCHHRAPGAGLGTGGLCRPRHHRPAAPRDLPPRAGALVPAHQYLSASLRLRERADRHSLARAARLWPLDPGPGPRTGPHHGDSRGRGAGPRAADPSGSLSYGDQKQLELGIALPCSPPSSSSTSRRPAWSPQETRTSVALVARIARERKLTVLFTEHDMEVRLLGGAKDPRAPPGAPDRGRRARRDPGPREVKRVYFGEGAIRTRRAP